MSADRFNKAAKDGLLHILSEATRKDANCKDDDSMTPVLWTAFEGHLDALRLLCGKGGDPDKCDQFGNTALHLASAKGHLHCVDFLIKFGVNMYALDIDRHSAKDLAAINNHDDILRHLDAAMANFEKTDRKKAKAFKELAERNCDKRIREYMRRQQQLESDRTDAKLTLSGNRPSNVLVTIKQKLWSSQGNLNRSTKDCTNNNSTVSSRKFSDFVESGNGSNGGTETAQKKTKHRDRKECQVEDNKFKTGENRSDGNQTVASLTGLRRDFDVLSVGSFSSNEDTRKHGKIADVFLKEGRDNNTDRETSKAVYGNLSRSFSQPDSLVNCHAPEGNDDITVTRSIGFPNRPILESIAFRRTVTGALCTLQPDSCSLDTMPNSTTAAAFNSSIKTKLRCGKTRSVLNISDSDSDGVNGYSEDDQDLANTPIQRFLVVWGLDDYFTVFQKQQIDLDTLMLLTEGDLKSLGLPLGPFRKLTFAIQERRGALANPGTIKDSLL